MTISAMPDVELLVATALRADGDVADLVGSRVYTEVPPNPTYPLVRVLRVSGERLTPRHVDIARIQVDVWANTKREGWVVLDVALASADQLPGVHDEGIVTAALPAAGPTWAPDPDTDQPRWTADVLIYSHPHPDNGS